MKFLLAVTALLTVACTPITEREREQREYQRLDFQAKYLDFSNRCQRKGGIVLVKTTSRIRGSGLPEPHDSYRCI